MMSHNVASFTCLQFELDPVRLAILVLEADNSTRGFRPLGFDIDMMEIQDDLVRFYYFKRNSAGSRIMSDCIQAYMQDHNKLPNSLEDLYDKSSIYDKETRNKYDYQVLSFSEKDNLLYFSYKLCTLLS